MNLKDSTFKTDDRFFFFPFNTQLELLASEVQELGKNHSNRRQIRRRARVIIVKQDLEGI